MSNDKRMQNPYAFPGANPSQSLTPSHIKRRSESHSSSTPFSSSASIHPHSGSKNASKRPSTSAGISVYSSSAFASSSISGNSTNSSGSGGSTIGPAPGTRIRHPYTVLKRGKRHHAYASQVAPYPLNYENRILDCDSLFADSSPPSVSPFIDDSNPSTHPQRVLDVGCGTGAWCLKAAQYWPNTQFVGLDLVAIQPESFVNCMQRIEGICRRVKEGKNSSKASSVPKLLTPTIPVPRRSTSSTVSSHHHHHQQQQQQQPPSSVPPLPSTTTTLPFSSSPLLNESSLIPPVPGLNTNTITLTTSPTVLPTTTPSSNTPSPASPLTTYPQSQRQTHKLLASSHDRIKWVHHNFLSRRGLPFCNEEFDLIHVSGIAHGVPEDAWDFLLGELARVLCIGGTLEIIEEDILFPVVLAPKIAVGNTTSTNRAAGVPGSATAIAHQQALSSSRAHQKSLKSAYQTALSSLNELNRQTLIYSEENRPSAFISSSSSSPLDGGSPTSYGYPHSPPTPIEGGGSIYEGFSGGMGGMSIGGGGGASGYYGIPASYLQYVQTVPELALSLPPLSVVNPFRHQSQNVPARGALGGTGGGGEPGKGLTPFAQDHAVLEKLYTSVYKRRWINMQPTKILANALGMQVDLGGVASSDCLEIAKPVGRAAFLGFVGDVEEEESDELDALAEEMTPAGGKRRGSGGSQTLLDEGDDNDSEGESDEGEDAEDEDMGGAMGSPPSPPLTPTATSPEGHIRPLEPTGAPRIRGAYPPQMRKRKRGRSSGTTKPMLGTTMTTTKGKTEVEEGEGKANVITTTVTGVEGDDSKTASHANASTSRSKSAHRRATRAAKTASMLSTLDFKKYPNLVLTTALQSMFPNPNTEISKTIHLQRSWENVVACKEAMWEEFLHDSAQREREAQSQTNTQQSPSQSSGSGKFVGVMGTLSSGIGGMGGMGTMGVMGGLGSLPLPAPFVAPRRVPTLLDELEWADSDMRRSERERFDILLDRYEMRIRRHCARAYENSGIPCLVARDRRNWSNAEVELYSSSEDEMYDDPVPPSPMPNSSRRGNDSGGNTPPSTGITSSSSGTPPSSRPDWLESTSSAALAASLTARDDQFGNDRMSTTGSRQLRAYEDRMNGNREEHSSSDEITLAEPQSPQSNLPTLRTKGGRSAMSSSVSPVSPISSPFGRDGANLSLPSSSAPLGGPAVGSHSARVATGDMASSSFSSHPTANMPRERGKRRMRSTSIRKTLEEKDDELQGPEKLPSRIIKAFIATKMQPK